MILSKKMAINPLMIDGYFCSKNFKIVNWKRVFLMLDGGAGCHHN